MNKILIANRGEIACRVIRSARKMGIATVAIYSDADRGALHVRLADEAYVVGPAPSSKSYLNVERILEVIDESGADAVHPGYGFLSENAAFCKLLQERRVTFIGPDPESMTAMGDKIASKELAKAAGVNTIPGHPDVVTSAEEAVEIARKVGYPVMIKASAGGGGKGMRIAHNDKEAAEGWQTATNEGRSCFNDGRVFIEKFIVNPRHIEIQILADRHGNTLYLNERECSIQRRNQKVIEEAPSPFVDPVMRMAMGKQAVMLARKARYVSAGTVEFVVGADKGFYFLEMNTRLQVEHPITEMITGIDLVEQMIRVARGEKLAFKQEDICVNGWAMECRLYAEDPYRNYMPSIGRLVRHQPPEESNSVRVDTGVFAGGEVSIHYDPMIAKLITHGKDRMTAINRMQQALDEYLVEGPNHNLDLLNAVMHHPRFQAGKLTTNFLAEEYPDGFHGAPITQEDKLRFAAAATCLDYADRNRFQAQPKQQNRVVAINEEGIPLKIHCIQPHLGEVEFEDGTVFKVEGLCQQGDRLLSLRINDEQHTFQVKYLEDGYRMTKGGIRLEAVVFAPRHHELAHITPERKHQNIANNLMSPMPGLVLSIQVAVGDKFSAGDSLCVLEAMKMENILRAEKSGTVKAILVSAGTVVESDAVIMEFE